MQHLTPIVSAATAVKAGEAIDAFIDSISDAIAANDKVQLIGFGTFEVRERAARTGRNPQTGEEMTIPAGKAPVFKAWKVLKERVAK